MITYTLHFCMWCCDNTVGALVVSMAVLSALDALCLALVVALLLVFCRRRNQLTNLHIRYTSHARTYERSTAVCLFAEYSVFYRHDDQGVHRHPRLRKMRHGHPRGTKIRKLGGQNLPFLFQGKISALNRLNSQTNVLMSMSEML